MKPPILVPVNSLAAAKGRLADVLDADQRAELALATLDTVLGAARDWGAPVTVLTADPAVAEHVRPPQLVENEVPGLRGLNPQLEAALLRHQRDELLILHADLPLASAEALESLWQAAPPAASATVVESSDGGTNAMLLRPPGKFALHYGPGSAAAHRAAAEGASFRFSRVDDDDLALDLDTRADIERLLALERGRTSAAGRLLRSWGF